MIDLWSLWKVAEWESLENVSFYLFVLFYQAGREALPLTIPFSVNFKAHVAAGDSNRGQNNDFGSHCWFEYRGCQ